MNFDGPVLNQRWRLGPRMGSGSQARTYLARDERDHQHIVVLKQFTLDVERGWKSFDLFEREVRVLGTLRHPGIPRYVESFESAPGVFNLVIERQPGATLRAIATKVKFEDHELRDILARVLEILDYIHKREPPIIHRDIKPANLLRNAKGKISLVDFGGVRDALRESGGSTIVGTFGYMAPEQLHGQATPATDIYGLGATIVSLAGKVEPEDVPRQGLRMDLETHLAGRDPGLISVLQAMTEPNPDDRPQSARAVIELLAKSRRSRHALARAMSESVPSRRGDKSSGNTAMTRTQDERRALARIERSMSIRKSFDDVGDMLAPMPRPLAFVLRIFLLTFSVGGYLSLAILQALFLPIVFTIVGAFTNESRKPRVESMHADIDHVLDDGRAGFRALQKRCWPPTGSREDRRGPDAKDDAAKDDADDEDDHDDRPRQLRG